MKLHLTRLAVARKMIESSGWAARARIVVWSIAGRPVTLPPNTRLDEATTPSRSNGQWQYQPQHYAGIRWIRSEDEMAGMFPLTLDTRLYGVHLATGMATKTIDQTRVKQGMTSGHVHARRLVAQTPIRVIAYAMRQCSGLK